MGRRQVNRNRNIRNRPGMTLPEVMFGMIVLAILVAIAVMGYQGYRDRAAMLVDETNQQVLQAAIKLYAYDTNALPGSLSQLRPTDLERAYARVSQGKTQYTVLAYLKELFGGQTAEAVDVLPPGYYNNDRKVLTCPFDDAADREKSYGLSGRAAHKPLSWLLNPDHANVILITEVKGSTGTKFRHNGKKVAVRTTVGGKHKRSREGDDDENDDEGDG